MGRAVSRVLYSTIIYLDLPSLTGSSGLPSGQVTGSHLSCPIWPCSGWGLHGQHVSMLPVSSYLTISTLPQPYCFDGMFLLHFPYSYLRQTLSGTLALWSPDFPHVRRTRDCLLYPYITRNTYDAARRQIYVRTDRQQP